MMKVQRRWTLLFVLLSVTLRAAWSQVATTAVQDTVYRADGTPAAGTVVVSWNAFTTALGDSVTAGSTAVTIGAGGSLAVSLAPDAGATPMGSYYTAIYHLDDGHLDDGSNNREYWVVPVQPAGSTAVKLSSIRNSVLPLSVAMQTVSKSYVDMAIARALDTFSPAGFTAGTIDVGTLNATSITGGVSGGAITSGIIDVARLPGFGASGTTHSAGVVPDPGPVAGNTRFLREDGSFAVPAGGSGGGGGTAAGTAGGDLSGTYPNPTVSAVHATGGTLNGVTIGGTAPAAANVTALAVAIGAAAGTESITTGGAVETRGTATTNVASAAVLDYDPTSGNGRMFAFGPNGTTFAGFNFLQVTSAGTVYFAQVIDKASHAVGFACGLQTGIAGCAASIAVAGVYHETLSTPASSTAACAAGDFTDDASYHYVCVAASTWKRVALSAF